MEITKENLKQLLASAKTERQLHEADINEIFDYTYPDRKIWAGNSSFANTSANRSELFDSTALTASRNLVANIMSLLIPSNRQWARIQLKQKYKSLESRLSPRLKVGNEYLFNHLSMSNFYLRTAECLNDNVLAGTRCVLIVDRPGEDLHYLPIPISELFILQNSDGVIDTVFREYKQSGKQMLDRFADSLDTDTRDTCVSSPGRMHTVIECYVKVGDAVEYGCYLTTGDWVGLETGRYKWNPYLAWRFNNTLGRSWGDGPGLVAAPHIRMLQRMSEDFIGAANFAARPAYQVSTDFPAENMIGEITPGAIINTMGAELKPIPMGGDMNITWQTIEAERQVVKTIFYDSTLPRDGVEYMKSGVAQALRAEFYQQIGEPATRLQREYLQPIASQIAYRLLDRGDIFLCTPAELQSWGLPIGTTQEDIIEVDVQAALTQTIRYQEAENDLRVFGLLMQVIGPQQTATHVDIDKFTKKLMRNFGFSADLIRTEREVQAYREESKVNPIQAFAEAMSQNPAVAKQFGQAIGGGAVNTETE